ncbi:carbohydrate kinase family protein [Streptomyces sp. TRM 70361]|uniref:carbohydrate kinase family protein n=1 Tax=Streptomyces sp. TRM 70361 TaxID=3116553 RepID=UPI002E7BD9B9|nr:carbohydrate kinase family protein [Streptomyces sp. TRM 70361]MEE1940385.1 carbohydrate kinase family protein [Streptomyces sp. TRM 70361]
MRIAVTGSIATDHLLVFPGCFTDQLIAEQLDRVSLSFLADRLEVRRGGVGANIAFGLARLGLRPVLVGAAGADFADYGARLQAAGVNTSAVRISETLHTARFMCTTDSDQNQIATFYAGAMAEARHIDLTDVRQTSDGLDLVLVGADDPGAMLRHTVTAHDLDIDVAADPSQQLARLDAGQVKRLVDGARWLFTNEYEAALLQERTGWGESAVLRRVGTWVVTRGADGVSILSAHTPRLDVPAVPSEAIVDPTGVGDAFRAGFLAGVARELPYKRAAQLGCALATVVLESVGTQEYKLLPGELLARIDRAYGHTAARAVEPLLASAA